MIIGIFLRHIKTYKGINFIPISDGSKFCGIVGENGVGKSTILESLDTFFHHKEWNINIDHVSKTATNRPYIMPIFLIEKNKLKLNSDEIEYVEYMDSALRNPDGSLLPPKIKDVGINALSHIQKVIKNLKNPDDYYILSIGIDNYKANTFGIFKAKIESTLSISRIDSDIRNISGMSIISQQMMLDKESNNKEGANSDAENEDLDDDQIEEFERLEDIYSDSDEVDGDTSINNDNEHSSETEEGSIDNKGNNNNVAKDKIMRLAISIITTRIFKKINDIYSYIYIPKELTAEEFTKLHNKEFEVLMGRTLNQTLESFIDKNLVDNINNKLDELIESINKDLSIYTYKTPRKRQPKLKKSEIYKLITDSYFNLRKIHQNFDEKLIPVTKLSSGEKQKAILNIASILLEKNHSNNKNSYIIFATDEPESSLHISACFDIFQKLHETSESCNQLLFTTHWYGFLPSVIDGSTLIISKNKDREHMYDFVSLFKFREEAKIMRSQSNRYQKFPSSIRLKGMNDLVQSIVSASMSDNPFNWIICEGSSEKIYFSHFLKNEIKNRNLRILPVGGREEVKQLYNHLSIAFKDFDDEISGKVYLLCDTDNISTTTLLNDNQHKKLRFRRFIADSTDGTCKLVHMNDTKSSEPTELEDVLNSKTYLKTLESFKEQYSDILDDLTPDIYDSESENGYHPSSWALDINRASRKFKKIKSFFDINPEIKTDFAKRYVSNVEDDNDLPWIKEIARFFDE